MQENILRWVSVGTVLLLVFVGSSSCKLTDLFGGDGSTIQLVQSTKPRNTSPDVAQRELTELVAGNSQFALDLYRVFRNEPKNIFYSPLSISLALAMTYGGARGETERQMAETLHFTLPQGRLHPAFNALDLALASRGQEIDGFQLDIANATWGQIDYAFLAVYLDLLAENYGTGMRLLDFLATPEESRQIINQWVSDQTSGKIKDLLPRGSITPATVLVLTNAIYFNAKWLTPFAPEQTRNGPFTLLDGTQVVVSLMSQNAMLPYAVGQGYEAVALPYKGEQMSMIILLPNVEQFEAFERSLSVERLAEITGELQPTMIRLTMPKFSYTSDYGLRSVLMDLGMPAAFSQEADFSGMDGKRELFISEVVHKAFVAVDEEGTEAAAATGVIMPTAAPASEVRVDHPFLYLIRDNETGTILFVGRVLNPVG